MLIQNIKVTTDALVFSNISDTLQLLLIKRGNDPYKGMWAFPGGFLEDDEELEAGALRELAEETGVQLAAMQQLTTVGTVGRDTRFRTVSVVYYAFTDATTHNAAGADDAADAQWVNVKDIDTMAFDHKAILDFAIQHLGLTI
jgi:8-oxo-dGTP diphosphatase